MKTRIKKLREELKLTQQAFAERLNVKRDNIAGYESGRREPSAAALNNICKTFGVNEAWLRTGEGEMFVEKSREDEIEAAVNQLLSGENVEFKRRLIRALASLTEKQWTVIVEKAEEIVGGRAAAPALPTIEAEARLEAEEYYRQLVIEKKAAAAASASSQQKDA